MEGSGHLIWILHVKIHRMEREKTFFLDVFKLFFCYNCMLFLIIKLFFEIAGILRIEDILFRKFSPPNPNQVFISISKRHKAPIICKKNLFLISVVF